MLVSLGLVSATQLVSEAYIDSETIYAGYDMVLKTTAGVISRS